MHIEHFNISAPLELLERLKEFYCELFELEEGFRPPFSRAGYWLYSGGNALIHLTESIEHFPSEKTSYFDHITFQLTGLKKLLEKLENLGIKYTTDHLPEIGMTQIFFKDPAGIGLEANFINERLPAS